MIGGLALSLIVAVLGTLYLIGRAGDVAARWHANRDSWKVL